MSKTLVVMDNVGLALAIAASFDGMNVVNASTLIDGEVGRVEGLKVIESKKTILDYPNIKKPSKYKPHQGAKEMARRAKKASI